MPQTRKIKGRGLLLLGCLFLIVLLNNPLGSISNPSSFIHTVGWYTLLWAGLALIVSGVRELRAKRTESNTADPVEKRRVYKSPPRVKNPRSPIYAIIILLCLLYVIYAAIHYSQGKKSGCNDHSILMTLFPVRQLYFIPTIEREWVASTGESIAESTNPFSMIGIGIAESLREPIMNVVRYGDCQTLYAMTGNEHKLGRTSQNSSVVRQIPTVSRTRENSIQQTWSARENSTVTPSSDRLTVTNIAKTNLRIRLGPGLEYDIVGRLRQGETAEAVGRNYSGSWILLESGWVSADYVNAIDSAIMKLPVNS